jgi:hypothetical protein
VERAALTGEQAQIKNGSAAAKKPLLQQAAQFGRIAPARKSNA